MTPARGRLGRALGHLRHTPGLGRDAAAVLAVVVVGLASGGYILSQQKMIWPWQSAFTFTADFSQAPGISPGNGQEVRIAGVRVGDIVQAAVTREGKARLTLRVDKSEHIYSNAHLVLRPKSPLNEMYVEVAPGGPPAAPLPPGGVIPSSQTEDPVQADEVLQHLDRNARHALGTLLAESDTALASLGTTLPPGMRATDGALSQLKPVAEQLATRRDKIQRLVTALSAVASAAGNDDARLTQLVTDARHTLDALNRNDAQLNASLAKLPGVTTQLRQTTASLDKLTGQLNPALDGLHAASGALPPALKALDGTVNRLNHTLDVAGPLAAEARPLVADLRPVMANLRPTLPQAKQVTARLDAATAQLVGYLPDLQNFVYNTTSVTSLEDANGGILRGLLEFSPTTAPAAIPQLTQPQGAPR